MSAQTFSKPNGNHCLELAGLKEGRSRRLEIPVHELILGGWTGRNPADLEAHIRELETLGVKPPAETPVFYRVAASLVTTSSFIDVIGTGSTGEVEFVLYHDSDEIWVGVGSDHTDRQAESMGITLSKQLCAKPVSSAVWCFSEVEPHWDELRLRSYTQSNGRIELYQDNAVSALRHPRNLLELYERHRGSRFGPGAVLFSGTPAALRGFEWADRFVMELIDPRLGRTLKHEYHIRPLTIQG